MANITSDPKGSDEYKWVKRRLRHHGVDIESVKKFQDRGMSNKYLMKVLKCGNGMLQRVVRLGERNNLFTREPAEFHTEFVGKGQAANFCFYSDTDRLLLFHTNSWVFYSVKSTSYILCGGGGRCVL